MTENNVRANAESPARLLRSGRVTAGASWADKFRLTLFRHLFSPLQGMTLADCGRLMWQNRLGIDPPYWPRGAFLVATGLVNSLLALFERYRYASAVSSVHVEPPLFVLGHYRSGTTHLQNLLSLDRQFAYPNLFQSFFPQTFLVTEPWLSRAVSPLMVSRRFQDDVALDVKVPMEDEIAMCVATSLSNHLGWAFPRAEARYHKYLTFREATDAERDRWKRSFMLFLRKLTYLYHKPILLKSPPHTARIRMLLELFPNARFVHIHRNPYDVFLSTYSMLTKTRSYWRLQRWDEEKIVDSIIHVYKAMYAAFLEDVKLIPEGHFCEIGYEEVEREPAATLRRIYEALGLPGYEALQAPLQAYLRSVAGYRKNEHHELDRDLRARISQEWSMCFEEWGYSP